MTVLITLTTADLDTGPFNLYSNLDGFVTPFATGITKSALVAGYSSNLVPDYTAIIRVLSTGRCTNYVDIRTVAQANPVYMIQGCRSGRTFHADKTFTYSVGEIVYFTLLTKALPYCGTIIGSSTGISDVSLAGSKPTNGCGDVNCGLDSEIP
jgi:hypothetical protein